MADPVIPSDPAVKDPTKASFAAAVNAALSDINANQQVLIGGLPANGSFELDFDVTGEPDRWTVTDISGSTHQLDTTTTNDGEQSLRCDITNGGGYNTIDHDDFNECNPGQVIEAGFNVQSDDATARVRLDIDWYNAAQTIISTTSYIDENTNVPSAFTTYQNWAVPPSTARFYKVRVTAGEAGNTVNAQVNLDKVFSRPADGAVYFDTPVAKSTAATGSFDISADIGGSVIAKAAIVELRVRATAGSNAYLTVRSGSGAGTIRIQEIGYPTTLSAGEMSDTVIAEVPLERTGINLNTYYINLAGTLASAVWDQHTLLGFVV